LPNFYDIISQAIKVKLKTAIRQGKKLYIRIHDSGDFYSPEYYRKWLNVFMEFMGNDSVHFYAYTKQVKMFNALKAQGLVPHNFTLTYSEGGLFDQLIDVDTDRHSRVFPSLQALVQAGYADAHENDLIACGQSHKIGLVYHGHKSKAWDTSAA
jgi:hypothetical protein